MVKKVLTNNKGLTLVELLVALAILIMTVSVAYPAISLISKAATDQIKESSQRDDVRAVSSYLTNDIRYSKDVTSSGQTALNVVDKDNVTIQYYLYTDADGSIFLVRNKGDISQFKEIKNVNFIISNSKKLVEISLVTDIANNKHTDLKVNRFLSNLTEDWQALKPPEDPFTVLIEDESVFVYGNVLNMINGGNISGPDGSVIIAATTPGATFSFGGGGYVKVKTIFIEKNVTLNGSVQLGNDDYNSDIFINGDFTKTGNCPVKAEQISVDGNVTLADGIFGSGNSSDNNSYIYVTGDVTFTSANCAMLAKKINICGDVNFNNDSTLGNDDSEVYIAGNVNFDAGSAVLKGSKIYIGGNVTFNNDSTLGTTASDIYIKGSVFCGKSNKWVTGKIRTNVTYIEGNITTRGCQFGNTGGKIYTGGNVIITGGDIFGDIYYIGTMSNYTVSAAKHQVSGITYPPFIAPSPNVPVAPPELQPMPSFQTNEWYLSKGYSPTFTPGNDMKYFGGSVTFPSSANYSNVRIASSGNITLTGGSLSGVLFAPNGTVTISGGTFTGIIIAKTQTISTTQPVNIGAYYTDFPF